MEDREKKPYKIISNNNLVRWLVGERSYFYVSRYKNTETGKMNTAFVPSKLLDELLEIYYDGRANGLYNNYIAKTSQKAE